MVNDIDGISSKKKDQLDTICLFERTVGLNTLETDHVIKELDKKYWRERQTDGLPAPEMGPKPTQEYFWPTVNNRLTRLWPGYFLTDGGKNWKICCFQVEILTLIHYYSALHFDVNPLF